MASAISSVLRIASSSLGKTRFWAQNIRYMAGPSADRATVFFD